MALALPAQPVLLASILLIAIFLLHRRAIVHRYLPPSIPWVGPRRHELLSTTRAHLREWKLGRAYLNEGYHKYSKNDKLWASPTITFKPELLLPRSYIPWLLRQPREVLSVYPFRDAALGLTYVAPRRVWQNRSHNELVRNELTRHLGAFAPSMVRDVGESVDELWGTETEEWREVGVKDSMQTVVLRVVMRVWVGAPLCEDKSFLEAVAQHGHRVTVVGSLVRLLAPDVLKPVLGRVMALAVRKDQRRCERILVPVIERRIEMMRRRQEEGKGGEEDEPRTLLDMLVESALRAEDPEDRTPHTIAGRLLFLSIAALATSALTMTNVLFDIAASPPGKRYLARIGEEAAAALRAQSRAPPPATTPAAAAAAETQWSRSTVAQLHRADSALRESLRLWGFGGRGLMHEVMPPEGLVLPDGTWVPRGAWVGVPVQGIHGDAEVYEDPGMWDGERFCRGREGRVGGKGSAGREEGEEKEEILKEKRLGLVSTGETFLAFGHGRDACPGRFFAAQQLKLILAYIALHYEIRPLAKRPENLRISDFSFPPLTATLEVRRRKDVGVQA